MKRSFTMLFAFAVLSFSACKKEFFIEGTPGAKGDQGLKGEQGLTGANGSTIHSGTGAPSATIGANGDFYLDKTTAQLYGPKAANGWPSPLSLKGNTGPMGSQGLQGMPGAAGTKILNGVGAPKATLGNTNDFYFDTVNMAFYGPKTDNSWGDALSLVIKNGVTTLLYTNQTFEDISFIGTLGQNVYWYQGEKLISINHPSYSNAYQNGLVKVLCRFSDDAEGDWHDYTSTQTGDDTEVTGDYEYTSISALTEDASLPEGIWVYGSLQTQLSQSDSAFRAKRFDIKVICIPLGTVQQMQAKDVNIKDAGAVAKYLGL